jgi:hypothetical protein
MNRFVLAALIAVVSVLSIPVAMRNGWVSQEAGMLLSVLAGGVSGSIVSRLIRPKVRKFGKQFARMTSDEATA